MTQYTKQEATEKAEKAVKYSLDELINPSDLGDYDSWKDIDRMTLLNECHESAVIMLNESQEPFDSIVHDLSVCLYMDSMPRVSMDYLTTDSKTTAVVDMGIWPNKYDKWSVELDLHDNYDSVPIGCRNEAWNTVLDGIMKGLIPDSSGVEL